MNPCASHLLEDDRFFGRHVLENRISNPSVRRAMKSEFYSSAPLEPRIAGFLQAASFASQTSILVDRHPAVEALQSCWLCRIWDTENEVIVIMLALNWLSQLPEIGVATMPSGSCKLNQKDKHIDPPIMTSADPPMQEKSSSGACSLRATSVSQGASLVLSPRFQLQGFQAFQENGSVHPSHPGRMRLHCPLLAVRALRCNALHGWADAGGREGTFPAEVHWGSRLSSGGHQTIFLAYCKRGSIPIRRSG